VQVAAGEARLAQHAAWVGSKPNMDRAFMHERMSGTRQLTWRYTTPAKDRVKDRMADRVKDQMADRVKDRISDRVYKVGRRPDKADS
jgi:hypothetical protein